MKAKCAGHKPDGSPCGKWPVNGATVCRKHGAEAPQVKSRAAVRAEVMAWGLGDVHVDPGEVLLRLVSQSAARAEHYGRLLAEAYDAAERLKVAHEAHRIVADLDAEDDSDSPETLQAKADLDRIFNTGGVAALIGNTYSTSNAGSLYATGEQIRGLALLEAQERDRCAGFATKAIAAGLAERQVRLAERQGALIADVMRAVLNDPELGLSEDQKRRAPSVIRSHIGALAA